MASRDPRTSVVKVKLGVNVSRATDAVMTFVEEAGTYALSAFNEPSRMPSHSIEAQLCEGITDAMAVNPRVIFPVRVTRDKVLGDRRADSTDTAGVAEMVVSAWCVTRDAVRTRTKYKLLKPTKPTTARIVTVRSGLRALRTRAIRRLLVGNTSVHRISIEMSESYCCTISTCITQTTSFSDSPHA